jgi:hypothetical protein
VTIWLKLRQHVIISSFKHLKWKKNFLNGTDSFIVERFMDVRCFERESLTLSASVCAAVLWDIITDETWLFSIFFEINGAHAHNLFNKQFSTLNRFLCEMCGKQEIKLYKLFHHSNVEILFCGFLWDFDRESGNWKCSCWVNVMRFMKT